MSGVDYVFAVLNSFFLGECRSVSAGPVGIHKRPALMRVDPCAETAQYLCEVLLDVLWVFEFFASDAAFLEVLRVFFGL